MSPICIKDTEKYGRGVYATRSIKNGELFEVAPVLKANAKEWKYLKRTMLYNYCYSWGENYDEIAIVLGYGMLYNHSYTPNATFHYNLENLTMDFYAIKDIQEGEEIKINYNETDDDQTPLWFDVLE